MADKDEVEIKQYSVIYQAIEDVEAALKGMLAPKYEEKVIGTAEIRETFKISNVGTIAGCFVLTGKLERNAGGGAGDSRARPPGDGSSAGPPGRSGSASPRR